MAQNLIPELKFVLVNNSGCGTGTVRKTARHKLAVYCLFDVHTAKINRVMLAAALLVPRDVVIREECAPGLWHARMVKIIVLCRFQDGPRDVFVANFPDEVSQIVEDRSIIRKCSSINIKPY